MRSFFIFSLLFVSISSFAQVEEDCADDQAKKLMNAMKKTAVEEPTGASCPNFKKVKNLCLFVSGVNEDPTPLGNHKYVYQRKVLEASCVDIEKDSDEVKKSKISKMWAQFEAQMVCNSVQFDVQNGSIIKYAAIRNFDSFISDVIKWKVHLNRVDESDGRTVLDYIKYHIERSKGSELEKTLKDYYDRLKKAGAKHKNEL